MEKIVQELLTPQMSVVSKFHPSTEFPLLNLDWNATSRPLRSVEEEVIERVFPRYGNPKSCGTLTSQTSQDLVKEAEKQILKNIGFSEIDFDDYHFQFGGDGSSYWFDKVAEKLILENGNDQIIVTLQDELHDSFTRPWTSRGKQIIRAKSMDWLSKYYNLNKNRKFVILISLCSHLTGSKFEFINEFSGLFYEYPDIVLVVDATSWLAHERTLPDDLDFDYLAFSGHKFPGGPGSPGCLITKKPFPIAPSGTPNVLGISKLAISTRLRYNLMKEFNDDNEHLSLELNDFFKTIKRGNAEFVIHTIDNTNSNPLSVFTFSVKLDDIDLLVHPQLVSLILLNAYGIQIRAGSQCAETCIRKLSIWEELEGVELSDIPILHPSVCRLSIPKYLLSRSLVDEIKEKFTDFLSSVRLFLACFEPSFKGWNFQPEFLFLAKKNKIPEKETITSNCSRCPGSSAASYKPFTNPSQNRNDNGLVLFSKIGSSIVKDLEVVPRKDSEHRKLQDHPFRWFALPVDIKLAEL